jgi:hypothetical protein
MSLGNPACPVATYVDIRGSLQSCEQGPASHLKCADTRLFRRVEAGYGAIWSLRVA